MSAELLIDPLALAHLIDGGECVVFDCRFELQHPQAGRNAWLAAHIPGAVYANLDENLSGRVTSRSGRHPLPPARSFAAFLARSGWRKGLRAVAYDAHGGALAARFWWLMKYYGMDATSLLDGGISAWMNAMQPLESGEVKTARAPTPVLEPRRDLVLRTPVLARGLASGEYRLLDAREQSRFEGLEEPIDPVAGHVPGALNHHYGRNLTEDRRFKAPRALKTGFRHVTSGTEPSRIVHMCGSGVTACQNLFAMELAGLPGSRLYAGSWSEWIRDPARPVALGSA